MSKKRPAPPVPFVRLFPWLDLSPRVMTGLWLGYLAVLAVVAFSYHRIGDYAVETDFYWIYAPHASALLQGTLLLDQFRGPGYEILLAAAGWLTGDMFRAGMILSLLSAGAVLWLTHRLVNALFGSETAILTCAGLALNHAFLIASYTAATDMVFMFLALLVVYLFLRQGSLLNALLAGLVSGFAYITRYNAIALFVAVPAALLVLNVHDRPWKERIRAAFVYLAGAMVFVLPWGIYTWFATGRFTYNNNFYNIAYEMYGKGKLGWDEYWGTMAPRFSSYWDVVAYDPARFFSQLASNAVEHFWNDATLLVAAPLGVFAIGGIVALARTGVDRRQGTLFLIAGLYYLVLLPVFYGERFSLFLVPVMLVLSVLFFRWRALPDVGFPSFGLKHLVLLGVLGYSAVHSYQRVGAEIGAGPVEILDVRDAYARVVGTGDGQARVAARKPHIAYYLKMQYVIFPNVGTVPLLLESLRKDSVDYLYFSTVEAGMRPQFRFLLEPRSAPPDLLPVLKVDYPPAVLYRLRKAAGE